jgi:hypothetical protein
MSLYAYLWNIVWNCGTQESMLNSLLRSRGLPQAKGLSMAGLLPRFAS